LNIWRISNHRDLAGAGGLRAGGRWHSPGRAIVYCAEHPASALLEILAHLDVANLAALPDGYQLLEIGVPDAFVIESLPTHALTPKWQSDEASTQAIGDRWLASRSSAMLRVPSWSPRSGIISSTHCILRPRCSRSRPRPAIRSIPACSSWSAAARSALATERFGQVRRGTIDHSEMIVL